LGDSDASEQDHRGGQQESSAKRFHGGYGEKLNPICDQHWTLQVTAVVPVMPGRAFSSTEA
jgi:hypothetical protein